VTKVLITGATGFLGSEIVRQAVDRGLHLVAMRRLTSRMEGLELLPVQWVTGDVLEPRSMLEAMSGVTHCIHTAGDTSYFLGDRARQTAVNVQGVRNVVEAARAKGVRRLVHTSNVAAIGFDRLGGVVKEDCRWNWPGDLAYMETKRDGEAIALEAADDRLEVVVLNPATIMGPGRMNASEEQLVSEIQHRKMTAIPCGGMTVCDVADVASAHLAALERGTSGSRYILGGHHVTHKKLVEALAEGFGVQAPRAVVPAWVLALIGGLLLWGERASIRLEVSAAMIRLSRFGIYHASNRAIEELSYSPRSFRALVDRVVASRSLALPAQQLITSA